MNAPGSHTESASDNNARIAEYQRRVRALPAVHCVWIRCDGEYSLEGLYETEADAKAICRILNKKPRYYGRAHWNTQRVLPHELVKLLHGDALTDEEKTRA